MYSGTILSLNQRDLSVSSEKFDEYIDNLLEPRKIKLPEGQGEPVVI